MRYHRSAAVLLLIIPLIVAMAIPGGAAPAQPGANLDDDAAGPLTGPAEGDPDELAIAYLQREHASLGLGADDVGELVVASSYTSRHNGLTHVNLNQRYDGKEIFGAYATVNVMADGSILHVGESLVRDLAPAADGLTASASADPIDAEEAVEAAADALLLDAPEDLETLPTTQAEEAAADVVLTDGGISDATIPARLGWQATDEGLRPAWQLVIDETGDTAVWNATIDAETGELLNVDNWTDEDEYEDLYAALARPEQSSAAQDDPTTHLPPEVVEDGSSYRVFDIPKESPYDGPRTLATNRADALASPFGWHDTDGAPGPEYTITRGNNAHAYTDRDANGDPDVGGEPDGGEDLTFDFPLDLTEHPHNNSDAAVTNLFYWNNIIHDVLYRYGFDEASGNFQVNNYGRGGEGGDDVRAEAQDGGGVNNANFFTPAQDGGRPRMQMYLWTVPVWEEPDALLRLPMSLTVTDGPAAGTHLASFARFGPAPTNEGTAGMVYPVDTGGDNSTGCAPYTVPAGSIALVDRTEDQTDECNYYIQALNAEAAGAVALVIANDRDAEAVIMQRRGSMDDPPGIPTIMVRHASGEAIRAAGPAPARVHHNPRLTPMRDGDFENGIILHEYGHGVSNRLTGGPTVNCLSGEQRMSEGWSDYLAIGMLIDPALDDPERQRGMGPYARWHGSREGAGIRPRPYSRNLEINPFTYGNIGTGGWMGGNLPVPHGIGWGWATVMWDMTWDLIDRHGFNDNIYEPWSSGGNNLAYQLVMDGLKIQGCGPGFLDGRDAILAADVALTGGENRCLLWNTFARRGMGYSAVQAEENRRDNNIEAFDLPADCTPTLRLLRGEIFRIVDADGMTEGMEQRITHALEMYEAWIQNPRQRGPALSHLDRAIRLLLWQADVIERSRPNQGDAEMLRALAARLQDLYDSHFDD